MIKSILCLTALLFLAPTSAMDMRLYHTANCGGGNFDICGGLPPNSCCGNTGNLWESCQPVGTPPHNYARLDTTAYSGTPSDSNSCANVLQTRPACVSISGNIIQGCKYRLEYIGCTRGICRMAVAEDAKKECMEPDMTGWEDKNGTTYALFKNGTAYQKLAHLRGKEKSDFNLGSYFKENADGVTARSDGSQIVRPRDSPTTKVQ
jgi:hypothetical protein